MLNLSLPAEGGRDRRRAGPAFDRDQIVLDAKLGASAGLAIHAVAPSTTQVFDLYCRNCGQTGHLGLTSRGKGDWSFTAVGFIGVAVNRHNLPNSVLRCNGFGSPQVSVEKREADDSPCREPQAMKARSQ
jgi:hypothetical protein